ncbi:IS66 family insertion sequence element accessory protein TnpB [Acidiphilium multivorum]|uniref:IS66 family insertion sequence element accessory protein TnpB n=1 Tax=Acidiphilium multivorum TaxID=62140 RepID=UPI0039C97546
MIAPGAGVRVYLACGRTDMRKGLDGLAMLVQQVFGGNPFDPTWTVGFIKTFDINSLYARVRVLPLHFRSVGSAARGRGFSLRVVR